jgi:hypothetical protein
MTHNIMVALIEMDIDGKSKQFMVYTIEGYNPASLRTQTHHKHLHYQDIKR